MGVLEKVRYWLLKTDPDMKLTTLRPDQSNRGYVHLSYSIKAEEI